MATAGVATAVMPVAERAATGAVILAASLIGM
jgi:hypothetical protein